MARIMPQPVEELLAWCPTWADEPRKRQPYMSIWVWVPVAITRYEEVHYWVHPKGLSLLADYLYERLGFTVARTVGWSYGHVSRDATLECVAVTVGSKQVRAKLAATA